MVSLSESSYMMGGLSSNQVSEPKPKSHAIRDSANVQSLEHFFEGFPFVCEICDLFRSRFVNAFAPV